jgi:hypothetical protein
MAVRVASIFLFICSSVLNFVVEVIKGAFKITANNWLNATESIFVDGEKK